MRPAGLALTAGSWSSVTPTRPGRRRRARPARAGRARRRERAPARPDSALLGLPEDVRDLGDVVEHLLPGLRVHGRLGAVRPATGGLGGLVEQLVELRVLLEVRRLEVVRPEHPEVVLDELGPLLLDQDGARPEVGVARGVRLLDDHLDGLGLDPRLRRVVDAARQVAVRAHGADDGVTETRKHVNTPSRWGPGDMSCRGATPARHAPEHATRPSPRPQGAVGAAGT